MPVDVLHILGHALPEATGIARLVASLAEGLDPRAYRLHACFLGADGPLTAALSRSGMSVHALGWTGGARDPAGALRLWRHLRGTHFGIIHQHAGGRSVRWISRMASDAALVVHLHGRVLEMDGRPLARLRPGEADAVIATSMAVARQVGLPGTRVVYPGVALSRQAADLRKPAAPGAPPIIGAAGRLVSLKGYAHLLRAVALLRPAWPELRVEIAGEGEGRRTLEGEARRLEVDRQITFTGWLTDMGPSLARWSALVQPSLEEGFGLAALEAMAAGLPVVATRVGGLPEVVAGGTTGLLVAPADPPGLAGAVDFLLRNPDVGQAMGRAGRERAGTHFSVDRMIRETSEIYATLAARTRAA